jgi:hypothetical protein
LKNLLLYSAFILLIASCSSPKKEDTKDNGKDTISEHIDANPTPEKDHQKKKKEDVKESDSAYYYEPAVSILSGTLKEETFYGPPGYGASPDKDSKEQQYILHLDNPISIKQKKHSDSGYDSKYKQDKITLDINKSASSFKHKIGKSVKVKGKLFPAETGHHHTDVIMGDAELVK